MNTDTARSLSRCRELLTWLASVANTAENHYWSLVSSEFGIKGSVSATPRDVADKICVSYAQVAAEILREMCLLTGATTPSITWSNTKTLTPQGADAVIAGIQNVLLTIETLGGVPTSGVHTGFSAAGQDFHDQVQTLLETLGTQFATVFTPKTPVASHEKIKLTILEGAETRLNVFAWFAWPVGSNWHQLATGDILVFTTLESEDYADFLNVPMSIATFGDSDKSINLTIPGGNTVSRISDTIESTVPGQGYVIRKLRG